MHHLNEFHSFPCLESLILLKKGMDEPQNYDTLHFYIDIGIDRMFKKMLKISQTVHF